MAVKCPLRRHFDYALPEAVAGRVLPGMRVRVPFGRREAVGLVLDAAGELTDAHDYKSVIACLDTRPVLDAELLACLRWAAAYYQHPIGEVIAAALPVSLRRGDARDAPRTETLHINDAGRQWLQQAGRRAPAQRLLLEQLLAAPRARRDVDARAARRLLDQALCELRQDVPVQTTHAPGQAVTLSKAQAAAMAALPRSGFHVSLLQGITGSGKTELYLQQAREASDFQHLLLVPEIGLTPQLLGRARDRLGDAVVGFHSGMTDAARLAVWRRIDASEPLLVVGTRSAVWLPFRKLAGIFVDEEHDVSFKQQDGFRYSARDVAIKRAHARGIPVVLGTATPSLESLANVRQGRYALVRLDERAQAAPGARIHRIDARGQKLYGGLTSPLVRALRRHLDDGGQALLFVNRRGYAPALLCRDCGWSASCRACDARMTWHKQRRSLNCHHCGAIQPMPSTCPGCGSESLYPAGQGTERVEEALASALKGARVARADSDVMQRAGAWDRLRADMLGGAIDVLVGTQMLAKGHDFPGVTLVGIVSIDQALFSTDLRATERMGQLIMQVAGRAGRGDKAGEVLLQTHMPEHPLLETLLGQGYDAFTDTLLAERTQARMPPARPLAMLRAEAVDVGAAMEFLRAASDFLRAAGLEALGPIPAPMERRAGRTRAQLWLQADSRPMLQHALAAGCAEFEAWKLARKVRWGVDVDPVDTL